MHMIFYQKMNSYNKFIHVNIGQWSPAIEESGRDHEGGDDVGGGDWVFS